MGEVFLLGQSMGGLSSLQIAAKDRLDVTAWAGIYPVTSLRSMWGSSETRRRSAVFSRSAHCT